ncbi:UNVERIFIED_CONTAM: hypothetical protein H355_009309 [Colinus virginianus]|nr:hypothetical protein H355_009309 [Colinus virginianus]
MIVPSTELTAARSISVVPGVIADIGKVGWLAVPWLCWLLPFFTLPAASLHGKHYFTSNSAVHARSQLLAPLPVFCIDPF